ncbi:hypothetical protein BS78_04G254600 [Paspalum vaginatum]|nr:hypothetical protein BS78_04G254600 [Paspalum vaginatum]
MVSQPELLASADVTMIPAPADSSSSSSAPPPPPPQPMITRFYTVWQVLLAMFHGAPAIPVGEDGSPAAVEGVRMQMLEGRIRAAAVGTMNSFLQACGRIPMICPQGPLDLNVLGTEDTQLPPPGSGYPVICAYCNCTFCFSKYDVPRLTLPPGFAFLEPRPVLATANLLAPPPVGPLLYSDGPGAPPVRLLVCSDRHHFKVSMGMLKLPRNAPSVVWKRPLGVLPTAVRSPEAGGHLRDEATAAGGGSSGLHAAAPNDAGDWNFVAPGDEEMVQLTLHDPLRLSL